MAKEYITLPHKPFDFRHQNARRTWCRSSVPFWQGVGYGYRGFRNSVGMGILWKFPQVFLWVWDGYGDWNPIPRQPCGKVIWPCFTVDSRGKTRGHTLKLIKKYSKGNTRHYFFTETERVISRWNSLPQEAVCAPSINAFKGHLTRIRNKRMGFFMDC